MLAVILIASFLLPHKVWAQSSPNLVNGQVPTAAQWNSFFSAKQDVAQGFVNGSGATTPGHLAVWGTYPNIQDGGTVPSVTTGLCLGVTGSATYNVSLSYACQLPRGYISGLGMSTAGSSSSFTVAAGTAMDSTVASAIPLGASLTKTTGAWTLGTSNGCLDTGSIATSTWYYVFAIERTDHTNTDILCSVSLASPTMPSNYSFFRYIGAIKTDGSSHWIKFWQFGDDFYWDTPVNDVSTTSLSTTATSFALSVPPGISVVVKMRGLMASATPGTSVVVTSPLFATPVAGTPVGETSGIAQVASVNSPVYVTTVTDTTQNVKAVASAASTTLKLDTFGWSDPRGKNN